MNYFTRITKKLIRILLFTVIFELLLLFFVDNEINGVSFMELNERNFETLFPGKLGITKKLMRVQQMVLT